MRGPPVVEFCAAQFFLQPKTADLEALQYYIKVKRCYFCGGGGGGGTLNANVIT